MTVLRSGAATDVGKVRSNNQDEYLVAEPLYAVADGMGGHAAGEIAARTAVAALRATFEADPTADGLAEGVRNANRKVWEQARTDPELRGMGTTMTAVALVEHEGDDVLAVVNVGDSRVYLLRDGELEQITEDHSVPEELKRAGRLSPAEAARHPQRNVLTRALGIEPEVEVDCSQITPYRGDRLVLASDGLFNEVDDDRIASVVRREADPEEAAATLVDLAREGGGSDNITVVVVEVVDDDDRAGRASSALAAAGPPRRPPASKTETETATMSRPVPGARATPSPAPPAPAAWPPPATPGPAPSAGIRPADGRDGRLLTVRMIVFSGALLLVLAGAATAVWFFARGGYYVGLAGEEVTIFKGRPGGLLWFDPTVAERTDLRAHQVRPSRLADLRDGKEEGSLAAARRYVANLEDEAAATTTTTTTAPVTTPPPAPAAAPAP